MKNKLPKYVRRKMAKGKLYLYFDTGQVNEVGKPILKALPGINDAGFGRAVGMAREARERRESVSTELTVAGLASLYEKSPKFVSLAAKTRESYSLYLRQIRERLGIAVAKELLPSDVTFVRDSMADRPSAANQLVRTLGALYKWGRGNNYVTNHPTKDVETFDPAGEHEPWPDWLIEKALEADDPIVRTGVGLLYFTAQRIGDVTRMRWTDIRDGAIHLETEKTHNSLVIPIHSRLQAILADAPREAVTIMLRAGKPWKPELLRRHLQRWASGHKVHIVAHGLRKSAVNALLEAGCSVAETAAISGQTLQMVEHYAKRRNKTKLASAAILRWEGQNKSGNGKQK
jgi:integrase